ncbi:release factor glutamine methyltransferase [Rhodococcus sp. OK519]|uniref:putative protein N(5)-glutamine methyltransferase n=1 Tax=Rhodococcus sp. OK519 TaxID=2135729 RepID=UPI000D3875FB|nr:release factor glutamine methyltransferase [Rhodococcus sp. OK519]
MHISENIRAPLTARTVADTLRAAGCVFAEDEARLLMSAAPTPAALSDLLRRRTAGMPIEHVLGWAEFCGKRIDVEPGVFVPRRRTELLVQEAVAMTRPGDIVVDLCCGSGAIGTVVSSARPGIELHAADVDPVAVRCARRNVEPVGGHVHEGDLFDALPDELRGCVDVLVANVPYVPSHAIALMPPEARDHEPRAALDGGPDGLDFHRAVAAHAHRWLSPGGHLLIEAGAHQASTTVDIFTRAGLLARVIRSDELDATAVVGALPGVY